MNKKIEPRTETIKKLISKFKKEVEKDFPEEDRYDSEYKNGLLNGIDDTSTRINQFLSQKFDDRISYWKLKKHDLLVNRHLIVKELESFKKSVLGGKG